MLLTSRDVTCDNGIETSTVLAVVFVTYHFFIVSVFVCVVLTCLSTNKQTAHVLLRTRVFKLARTLRSFDLVTFDLSLFVAKVCPVFS